MHNQNITNWSSKPPTGPTDQEAHLDSKKKGFSTIEFNAPK
jgi:hypothetical protein